MDTAVPTTSKPVPDTTPSIYTWQDVDANHPGSAPSPAVDTPAREINALPAPGESARAATVRRVTTGLVGLGLVAAAALAARGLRGDNARAGANVIDYDD